MKVFKFGGASIKNAAAVRNMCEIIRSYQKDRLVVVVSAMGKSTNALERIHESVLKEEDFKSHVDDFIAFHKVISKDLFGENEGINDKINQWVTYLNQLTLDQYNSKNQLYDSIVSVGELLSSTIIAYYLNHCGINTVWADVRQLIVTDNAHREAIVNWKKTNYRINEFTEAQNENSILLTQGFIAGTKSGATTTLGREGSDFTGAIFSSCLEAESFTVWKDVPGILNGDPRRINDPVLFDELDYNEASEMTYYGAKVIHPNTIKPLANQNIPMYVKCFDSPDDIGTRIHKTDITHNVPVIIFKENQCLVSFKSKDLAFVNEEGISTIFKSLHELSIDMHIMQNSAVSFSICIDFHEDKINQLIQNLQGEFSIRYNTDLELITIKNYTEEAITTYLPKGEVLLEQKSRSNYRVLMSK